MSNVTSAVDSAYAPLSPVARIFVAIAVFLLSGACEIGGGWLVWQTVRNGRPWWWALIGSLIMVAYGFVAASNPIADFGRVYAAYGGVFILLAFTWAHFMDGFVLDAGDILGLLLALAGVVVIISWRRPV